MRACAVICECASNGLFYIEDCRKRGIDPVVVFPPAGNGGEAFIDKLREAAVRSIGDRAEILWPSSVEECLGMLEGRDIRCVLAGSEYGIRYADILADRLGLPGNDPATTGDRTAKSRMQKRLEETGRSYTATAVVRSADDVRRSWKAMGLRKAIVKPDISVGSMGLHICGSPEEAASAVESLQGTSGWSGGDLGNILLQEFVEGREYIVNTLSHGGIHRITDMWVYDKVRIGDGMVPLGVVTVHHPGDRDRKVASYALEVLEATGMAEGPAHLEIMLSGDMPKLMEINARPMGAHFSPGLLDLALGHHITDLSLHSALDPEFIESLPEGIPPMQPMVLVLLALNEDREVDLTPLSQLVRLVPSFRSIYSDLLGRGRVRVEASVDFVSTVGSLELINDDPFTTLGDYDLLVRVVTSMPDLLFGPKESLEPPAISGAGLPDGTALILDGSGIRVHSADGWSDPVKYRKYDRCQVRSSGPVSLDAVYGWLSDCLDMMDEGGTLELLPEVADLFPYGRKGMVNVLMMANLEFDPLTPPDEPLVAGRVHRQVRNPRTGGGGPFIRQTICMSRDDQK